jgi:hypothetical protein
MYFQLFHEKIMGVSLQDDNYHPQVVMACLAVRSVRLNHGMVMARFGKKVD